MPGRGQYWKKGGLIDETVKEEDLSQALQGKVNAGGGGGSDFSTVVFEDDFFYADPSNDTWLEATKYMVRTATTNTSISLDQPQSGKLFNGVLFIEVSSSDLGKGGAFRGTSQGSGGGNFDSSKNITLLMRSALVNDITNRVDGMGLVDDNFGIFGGTTGQANCDTSVDEGFYFKKDSSSNWIAVSQDSNTNTDTDTGVSATLNTFQDFEIIHTPGVSDVFKIDGNTVVTNTTTIADSGVNLFLDNSIMVLETGVDKATEIDLWKVTSER